MDLNDNNNDANIEMKDFSKLNKIQIIGEERVNCEMQNNGINKSKIYLLKGRINPKVKSLFYQSKILKVIPISIRFK